VAQHPDGGFAQNFWVNSDAYWSGIQLDETAFPIWHGRFPVTLYKEQWLRVLASAAEIEAFIRENESKLKTKE
jgi:hypothetical protein